MNHFVGIPLNFPVVFSNFLCFHQYSREFKILCVMNWTILVNMLCICIDIKSGLALLGT